MGKGKARHLFPGNNTSVGFFSYYSYIMPQKEAAHIYCLKGGPGVGKSTFMRSIGSSLQNQGLDVEYLHCSSDPDSLDGVVFPDIHVALMDATAPHVVDPINPGAVDEIVNLGEYWDITGIKKHKTDILRINAQVGQLFERAYKYIAAAKKVWDDITQMYSFAADRSGAYIQAQTIIEKHLSQKPVCAQPGMIRKQFASAITPSGIISYLDTIIDDSFAAYCIKNHWGIGVHDMLERIVDAAVVRGFDTEVYYCPLAPETKMEHIVIPELRLAIYSENAFTDASKALHTAVNMTAYTDMAKIEHEAAAFDEQIMRTLLGEAVATLKKAKAAHDRMEAYYIPHMDFDGVNEKRDLILRRIQECISE